VADGAGSHFEPQVFEAFASAEEEIKTIKRGLCDRSPRCSYEELRNVVRDVGICLPESKVPPSAIVSLSS
jgi:hypothetical protein